MNYTLYIDESGDFISDRGQWVLSGMLFADSYDNCERILTNKLENMPLEFGLKSIKQFHLTEFRRDFGHSEAVDMAKRTFNKLNSLPFDYHCLVAINYTKSSLSSREKTYRLMLSDLLALCETTVPENEIITNLDLIVATRTIDGELQTNISNINEEIIKSLPIALEVDLATKGMVELIGKHIKVKMDYANNSWGLVCADFLANLNYHNQRENEKKFLEELAQKGKYSLFESFGGFEVRRANIAERDKDYVLALYRWIIIGFKQTNNDKVKESIQRLLFKIFNSRGTSGHIISFEAILERLWRSYNSIDKYQELSIILAIFEFELIVYMENNQNKNYNNFLFRLRNLMLIVENHLGDTTKALLLAEKQNEIISSLASNPEFFQMILDFKITEIEIYVNSLNPKKAFELSTKYYSMIGNYKEVWQLLVEQDNIVEFNSSRANIKAEMTLLRCNILYIGVDNHSITYNFIEEFNYVEKLLINRMDISRFNNYKIMLLLKQKKSKEAVEYFIELYKKNNEVQFSIFDFLWFLRASNDALLSKQIINTGNIKTLVGIQILNIDLNQKGHPVDLILRELALYEFQVNNKSQALKYIKKSKNAFDLGDSNIAKWLKSVLDIHEDYINGKVDENKNYFIDIVNNKFVKFINNKDINLSLIDKVRYYSPY
jgi:hypothetical protein